MQNKLQVANQNAYAEQNSAQPPIPNDYGPTVSAVAALLSLFAIGISISTAIYSRRSDRRSLFDSDYGTPLRSALRQLEEGVDELGAFVFPSAKKLSALKNELQETQSTIEERTLACTRLIREIDTATTVSRAGWEQKFLQQAETARNRLEALYSPNVINLADFQGRADQARDDYRKLIAGARMEIDDIRRSCLKDRTSRTIVQPH